MNYTINKAPGFDSQMSRVQTVLGWCYVPLYIIVIPLLLSLYAAYAPVQPSDIEINLIYYGISVVFTAAVMGTFLRRGYDVLLDNIRRSLLALLSAFLIEYAMSIAAGLVLMLLEDNIVNPNNDAIMSMTGQDYGRTKALVIFIAPIIEEVMFRGVIFGSIRRKSRATAYIVSVIIFSFCHVWQYAIAYGPEMLLYVVQYIPISVALAWAYERSGTIWVPIFFHMASNMLSFMVLSML